jgi:carbonic anhydrase
VLGTPSRPQCPLGAAEDDPAYFLRMAEQQTPRYLWVGCSDSRVTANDVLDLDPGAVFVHRNIANMVHSSDMNLLAVLKFAVQTLRIEHVIVCGHYGCGGVCRAMVEKRSALVDHWLQPLVMLYRKYRDAFDALPTKHACLDHMCELNVQMQVRRIAATPIVEAAWSKGQRLAVHGWIYAMHDGLIRDLQRSVSTLHERDVLPSIGACARSPANLRSGVRLQATDAFGGTHAIGD